MINIVILAIENSNKTHADFETHTIQQWIALVLIRFPKWKIWFGWLASWSFVVCQRLYAIEIEVEKFRKIHHILN